MNVRFLTARAWLDADDLHVWVSHDCLDGRETHMLPYPQWHVVAGTVKVEPSYSCLKCGCHVMLELVPNDIGESSK